MRHSRLQWIQALRLAAVPTLCFLVVARLGAQDPSHFSLPEDEEVTHLLEAIDTYQRASVADQGFVDPAYLIQSLKRLEARISANPDTSEALRLTLPLIYFRINQNALAVRYLERYASGNPSSARGRLLLAFGYLREEKYQQAKNLLEDALVEEPENAYAHHLMGLSQLGLNDLAGAAAQFERSIALDPQFAEAHFQLGTLQSKNRDTVEVARQHLEKAEELGLDLPEVHTRLGSVQIQQGRYAEAVSQLKRAIELDPKGSEAQYLLAEAYRKSNQPGESESALRQFALLTTAERARKEREAKGRTYFEEAIQLLRSDGKQLEQARDLLRKTVEIFPGLAVAFYRLAQTELLLGGKREAGEAIRRAIQINPLEAEYHFILSRCLEKDDPTGAIEAIGRAISLDPSVADFHNLLGNLTFQLGDYAAAERAYRKATALQPDNAAFHLNLSSVLAQTGDSEGSRKERELYLELVKAEKP